MKHKSPMESNFICCFHILCEYC